jgi:hypothetical protein
MRGQDARKALYLLMIYRQKVRVPAGTPVDFALKSIEIPFGIPNTVTSFCAADAAMTRFFRIWNVTGVTIAIAVPPARCERFQRKDAITWIGH